MQRSPVVSNPGVDGGARRMRCWLFSPTGFGPNCPGAGQLCAGDFFNPKGKSVNDAATTIDPGELAGGSIHEPGTGPGIPATRERATLDVPGATLTIAGTT